METHGDRVIWQQRGRGIRLYFVRMIHAEHHERRAILRALAVLARALPRSELIRANRVLRPEIARTQAVDAGEESWHALDGKARQLGLMLQSLIQGCPYIA